MRMLWSAGVVGRGADAVGVHLGWIVTVFLVAVLVVLLLRERRHRRLYRDLLERLDRLASGLSPTTDEPEPSSPPASVGGAGPEAGHRAGHPSPTPTRDVLAGMTARLRRLVSEETSSGRSLAEQAIVCVHRRLKEGVTVEALAGELHVSPRTLQRGLGLALGCTPRQLILAMRMREARRLLTEEGLPVKVAAARLGFADQHHFSRCFKSFYHVAPSSIRRTDPVAAVMKLPSADDAL